MCAYDICKCKFIKLLLFIVINLLTMYVTMKLPFVSSREGQDGEGQNQSRSRSIQISLPCKLVMDLLSQGAILQLQMGPLPLRPNLARPEGPRPNLSRPASSPERPESRPEPIHMRPNVPRDDPRPNPTGRTTIKPPRPERPVSR